MITRDIRDARNRLLKQSKLLKIKLQSSKSFYQFIKVQKEQDEIYKKWRFYDGIIKAFDGGVNNV